MIIQVLGPTGSGKSRVAVHIAKTFNGEIISADSSQVYRDFDIGTDKIIPPQREGIPHHLIDIFSDCAQFNAHAFLESAYRVTRDLEKRGKLPVICGGTALYLRVMMKGIFPEKTTGRYTRERISQMVNQKGLAYYWGQLNSVDPEYARKIGQQDRVRIIRALEIWLNNDCIPSDLFKKNETPFRNHQFIRIGINLDRQLLYRRIEDRVERMVQKGLLAEVRGLIKKYPRDCPPFKSIGYKEMIRCLDGEINHDQAVALIKQNTRNLAKRQLSWYRREKDIHWFSPQQMDGILELVRERLLRKQPL